MILNALLDALNTVEQRIYKKKTNGAIGRKTEQSSHKIKSKTVIVSKLFAQNITCI